VFLGSPLKLETADVRPSALATLDAQTWVRELGADRVIAALADLVEGEEDWGVLNTEGVVPDGFVPAGSGVPSDAESVRNMFRREGVAIDGRGRASPRQRFTVDDWV
jgi:hypothetical protein